MEKHADASLHLVELDADHPGFRDPEYRQRRDAIARIARSYRSGDRVPDAPYSEAEQAVWRAIWERLEPLHRQWVCARLNAVQAELDLARGPIPQLAQLNRRLVPASGFRMEPVAGLILAREFLLALGRGVFLSTQYMRHASRPFYTPEPDVVHETVGHAASLIDPQVARINRALGEVARVADDEQLERLNRVYWYTLEFGVVREGGGPKALGAGLLSSVGELEQMSSAPELLPWDLDAIAATPYDPTDLQPALFVAPSADDLLGDLERWLADGGWRP